MNLVVWESPEELEREISVFIEYYRSRRHHATRGNLPPDDVLFGKRDSIQTRRKRVQGKTLARGQAINAKLALSVAAQSIPQFGNPYVSLLLKTYIGMITAAISFIYGAWMVLDTLAWGNPVRGNLLFLFQLCSLVVFR